ncbi:HAD family hydrolase [Halalkalicoccus salilacus]|uniref:hypothetical protein n=1 Tax=Halalkalicoccus sp. GCM10025704 TaxID=3252662 RepID=UPI0036123206
MTLPDVDALVFDVFGTVVDWRSGVVRDGRRLGEAKELDVDWAAFADAWREEYQPSLARVRRGRSPGETSTLSTANRSNDSSIASTWTN